MKSPPPQRPAEIPADYRASVSLGVRVALGGLAVGGLLLLATARTLEPDPRGFGTHEQLGFAPCWLQTWTGYACPSCGATTAWALAMRGQLREAVATNGAATLLALATPVVAGWLLVVAARGRWLVAQPTLPMVLTVGTVLMVVLLVDWCRRTFL
mgnify:CR=1 FL=1